jgi:hypothetical protein
MNFVDGVWAVEYARGPLPIIVPFGLADVLLSTLDFATAVQTVSIYADLISQRIRTSCLVGGPTGPIVRLAATALGTLARQVTDLAGKPRCMPLI